MSDKNFKRVAFQRACGYMNDRGHLMVGKDGTVIMDTISASTGERTMVILSTSQEELQTLIGFLMHCESDHPAKPESVLDPDLAQMLNINTTKH